MTTNRTIEFRNPFLCPNCGLENARWHSDVELVICPDCGQEVDLDNYAINEALEIECQLPLGSNL